jgi:ribosome-associated toxin RatA of RatAB toxin-antitoxin module
MVRLLALWVMLPWAPFASPQAPPAQFNTAEVTVRHLRKNEHSMFEVKATGLVRAAQQQAWNVLTDYERLQDFVPDLRSSTLLARNGQEAIVEQHSESGFLFLSQTVHLVVRVTEQPFSTIDVALISGDMRSYSAHWELAPVVHNGTEGTRINFSGVIEPAFFIPPFVGKSMVQVNIKRMVEAVLGEIDKRSAGK